MIDPTTALFEGRSIKDIPAETRDFMCVALVRPGSRIAQEWRLDKPAFCIYEYTAWAAQKHEIRWGDGSGQELSPEDVDGLILLREFGEPELDALFNN